MLENILPGNMKQISRMMIAVGVVGVGACYILQTDWYLNRYVVKDAYKPTLRFIIPGDTIIEPDPMIPVITFSTPKNSYQKVKKIPIFVDPNDPEDQKVLTSKDDRFIVVEIPGLNHPPLHY